MAAARLAMALAGLAGLLAIGNGGGNVAIRAPRNISSVGDLRSWLGLPRDVTLAAHDVDESELLFQADLLSKDEFDDYHCLNAYEGALERQWIEMDRLLFRLGDTNGALLAFETNPAVGRADMEFQSESKTFEHAYFDLAIAAGERSRACHYWRPTIDEYGCPW